MKMHMLMPTEIGSEMANYTSPYDIGVGDVVNFNGTQYTVLTNYIKGETDAQGHTPRENRTILIDDSDNRTMCQAVSYTHLTLPTKA